MPIKKRQQFKLNKMSMTKQQRQALTYNKIKQLIELFQKGNLHNEKKFKVFVFIKKVNIFDPKI